MAWDFFSHTRTLELLYHKMQAPVLEEYHLTQIELDVLLFLSHHPQQDTAKDIVEIRRLTKSHVSAAVEGLVQRQYLQRLRRPDNKKLIHLVLLPDAMPAVQAGQARQREFSRPSRRALSPRRSRCSTPCSNAWATTPKRPTHNYKIRPVSFWRRAVFFVIRICLSGWNGSGSQSKRR